MKYIRFLKKLSLSGIIWQLLVAYTITLIMIYPSSRQFPEAFAKTYFYLPFLITLSASIFLVSTAYGVSIYLDRKYSWANAFLKRGSYQLLLGCVIPTVTSVLYVWLSFHYLEFNVQQALYSPHLFPLIVTIAIVINMSYMLFSLYFTILNSQQTVAPTPTKLKKNYSDFLMVPDGNGEIKLMIAEIAYLYVHDKKVAIQLHNGHSLILYTSLRKIVDQLDPAQFCEISRSFVITKLAVCRYDKHKDRGITIKLQPAATNEVKVSRKNVRDVVNWIENKNITEPP